MPEVFRPGIGGQSAWYQFLGGVAGRYGTTGWYPGPAPFSGVGNLGSDVGVGGGAVTPGRAAQQAELERRAAQLRAESTSRSEFQALLQKEVRDRRKVRKKKLKVSKSPLLDFELERRKGTDFAQLLEKRPAVPAARDVPSRKAKAPIKRDTRARARQVEQQYQQRAMTAADVGTKLVRRRLLRPLTTAIPQLRLLQNVADVASIGAAIVEEYQLAAMEKALGPSVFSMAGRKGAGPRTRGSARRRPAPKRDYLGELASRQVPAIRTREAAPRIKPVDLLQPVPDFAKQAEQQAKQAVKTQQQADKAAKKAAQAAKKAQQKAAKAAAKARKRELMTQRRARRAFERARKKRLKAEKRTAKRFGTAGSLRRWANQLLGQAPAALAGLTGSRTAGVRSAPGSSPGEPGDQCKAKPDPCKQKQQRQAAAKRKRNLSSENRICYAGTWRDTRKGRVTLTDRRIPCQ